MADDRLDLTSHIRRLQLERGTAATTSDLARIESLSGATLPALFKSFLSTLGGARCNCVLADGPAKGQDVIFFQPAEILSRLEDVSGEKVVPFADDLMGDVYYLTPTQVRQFVDADDSIVDVAPSFESLLEMLKVRE